MQYMKNEAQPCSQMTYQYSAVLSSTTKLTYEDSIYENLLLYDELFSNSLLKILNCFFLCKIYYSRVL